MVPARVVRAQVADDFAHARIGRFGRSFLAGVVPGRDTRRCVRAGGAAVVPRAGDPPGRIRRRRHGGLGRRVHRRGHGRHRHDFRDDSRLHSDHSDDAHRGPQLRHPHDASAPQHLHAEARPARARAAGHAANELLRAQEGQRGDGYPVRGGARRRDDQATRRNGGRGRTSHFSSSSPRRVSLAS